ncbi:MAG: glycine oxidase ThiO [Pirellula sp.]
MTNAQQQFDLMLCGGGVIGLSIAYECARHGWKVVVVDAHATGQAASWAGAGILPAGSTKPTLDPLEQLRSMSHVLHREWATRLFNETGIDNEYRQCGGLYLARTAGERATLFANRHWWDEHGIRYELWSQAELRSRIPAMERLIQSTPQLESWFLPNECRLRNPRHVRALAIACQRLGVTLIEHTRIDALEATNDRIKFARSGDTTIQADRYCITNGAWASQLLVPLGIETGVLPVRGQMVLYKLPKPIFDMVLNDGHRYLVPRDDGHVLAGSCEEEVGFDTNTTVAMIAELRSWAESFCPALAGAPIIKAWAGLRPGSFDSLPYLGTMHPYENAYMATGHFRHGLHWSTATAVLMHQWMRGQKTEIDLGPFCVGRGKTLAGLHS